MTQDPKEIDDSYKTPDPWGYQNNDWDKVRKTTILMYAFHYGPYERALDIGAGEGWITQDLPAKEIFGYEVSDTAASRFPNNVKRVKELEGKYDLVIATGVMYEHYDCQKFIDMILKHASGIIILCNIKDCENKDVKRIPGQIHEGEFPYREYIQKLRIYDFNAQYRQKSEL